MKTIVLSCSLAALMCGHALAADLSHNTIPTVADTLAAPVPGKAINWTSIYIGGQGGYGNSNHKLEAEGLRDATPAVTVDGQKGFCSNGVYPTTDGACPARTGLPIRQSGDRCASGYTLNESGTSCLRNSDVTDGPTSAEPLPLCRKGAPSSDGLTCEIASGDFIPATDVHVVDGLAASTVTSVIDGLNSHGLFGGGTVGADVQKDHLLFGIFGDYNFNGLDTKASIDVDGTNIGNASIKEGDSWLVAARVGYLFGEEKRALLYGLGGYGQTDVSYHVGSGSAALFDKDVTFSGYVLGAGGEYALTNALSLSVEYQHFFGGKETLFNGPAAGFDNLKVTDDMDSDKVMAKLKLKLNAGLFGY